jgi:hypothetical protein
LIIPIERCCGQEREGRKVRRAVGKLGGTLHSALVLLMLVRGSRRMSRARQRRVDSGDGGGRGRRVPSKTNHAVTLTGNTHGPTFHMGRDLLGRQKSGRVGKLSKRVI